MKSQTSIFTVLTTINPPNPKVGDWKKVTRNKTIVIGDNKTPDDWTHSDCIFVNLKEQKNSKFKIAKTLNEDHYTRKNLGYLYAFEYGATKIIDTDDDNFPLIDKWNKIFEKKPDYLELKKSLDIRSKNIYSYFSDNISPFWPRGFPLDEINSANSLIFEKDTTEPKNFTNISLWQCMVDGDPDVDAIHRLIFKSTPRFKERSPLIYNKNNFCAFNSQNTLWNDIAIFPLLYLPSTVTFRFTDILRSHVAQVIMNSLSIKWGFYPPTAYQNRNDHNLMMDFESEVSMYLKTKDLMSLLLDSVNSSISISDNLANAYNALASRGIVKDQELNLLDQWLDDISNYLNFA